jgi:hypothetical protein
MCPFAHGYFHVDIVRGDEYKRNPFFQIKLFSVIADDNPVKVDD